MRILHIITRLIVGGAQENTLLTCEGLHARGHDVTLVVGPSPGPEGSLLARAQSSGYKVIVTPHLVRSPHPWHDARAYSQIKQLIRDLKPDIVHTHSSKAGILGRAAAWKARWAEREPLVVHTIHGLPFHPYQNPLTRAAWIHCERFAAKRCHAIITVADAMTRQALAAGVGRPDQFTTIYSGMEVEPFLHPPTPQIAPGLPGGTVQPHENPMFLARRPLNIPADRIVFATLARLQPLKGHDDLLQVAAHVLKEIPNAHFLWIGDGIFRARFEETIRQNNWQNHFTLTGLVPPEEVPATLAAADVVVHPSYREGLARALPQALLMEKPVISYDCDGANEVCLENQTGKLVKTGDAPALGNAMIWMAMHPTERQQMAQHGRQLCLTRFPAPVMVNQIETLYLALQSKKI